MKATVKFGKRLRGVYAAEIGDSGECVIVELLDTSEPATNDEISHPDFYSMAVKHKPTGEVHRGTKGGKTGCGFNTLISPIHWVASTERVTCTKDGCKN